MCQGMAPFNLKLTILGYKMKTYKEFITEAKTQKEPKVFQICTQGHLDKEFVDAIVSNLRKEGVQVDSVEWTKGSDNFIITVSKGSLAKIKKSWGVMRAYDLSHDGDQAKVRMNTLKGGREYV